MISLWNSSSETFTIEEPVKRDEYNLMEDLQIFHSFQWDGRMMSYKTYTTIEEKKNEILDVFWDIINIFNYYKTNNSNMPWEDWFWIW